MMHRAPLWVNFFAIAVLAATCAASPVATTLSPPLPKIDFIGPPDAVAPLVLAIAVLRRINTTLAAGGEPPLTELRRAERLLESASFDPRTYEPNAESPTNAHGIIVTGISLGRFLDQRGYRADAHRTWGVVVHTADRAEPAPPSERRALKLYVDKRYVESFEVFAHWRAALASHRTCISAVQAVRIYPGSKRGHVASGKLRQKTFTGRYAVRTPPFATAISRSVKWTTFLATIATRTPNG